ncbi:MAG: putative glycine dehydrogenase (decarboxylating) subunit 1 [Micavibrio sp.]|nr:MAG: putative glycine dehydrogenase (decarboxylating) subunit 1 [Micavibrio sp.]
MRYLPQTKQSRAEMLQAVGASNVDDLFKDVPKDAFIDGLANLPLKQGELEVERALGAYANQNMAAPEGPFFLGAGTYYHHIPASVDTIIQRSEYLTAYTPYQPEIAQGTLQMIFEFQTFIAQLTGQEVANASLYDGATATAEAALMAMRVTKRNKVVIGNALHPHYRGTLKSYMGNLGSALEDGKPDGNTACVIVQSPDFYGKPEKYEEWRRLCNESGALLVVVVNEIVSLGLLPAPVDADIVCGEAQSIGLPMSFGGPHLGFFACQEKYLRQMPGRLCGMTEDVDGKRGFVLTLSTREQHIRREKATSNICTNQGLCALAFTAHMSLLGEDGFKRLAKLNHEMACKLADSVSKVKNVKILSETFFNEFVVELSKSSAEVVESLITRGIIAGYALDDNQLLLSATEMTTDVDIELLCDALSEVLA